MAESYKTGTGNKSATKDSLPKGNKGTIFRQGQTKEASKFGFDPSKKVKGSKS